MDPKLVEKLHEEASNAYLQGDVEGALSAWKQVLAADPADERALEGVDLCERMSGCESASVVTTGQSPFAVGSAPESPESSGPPGTPETPESSESPDDLGAPLDDLLEMGDTPPPPAADTRASETSPADDLGGIFDLSDLADEPAPSDEPGGLDMDELLSAPAGRTPLDESVGIPESLFDDDMPPAPPLPSADPEPEPESTWHFGVGPEPEETPIPEPPKLPEPTGSQSFGSMPEMPDPPGGGTSPGQTNAPGDPPFEETSFRALGTPPAGSTEGPFVDPPPEVGGDGAAAASLHRRASDLLANALAEMERGDREVALTTLDRLLILDEDNEAARSLKQKLTAEVQSENGASKVGDEAYDRLEMKEDPDDDLLELNLGQATAGDASSKEPAETVPVPPAAAAGADAPADDSVSPATVEGDPAPSAPLRRRFALPSIPMSNKIWVPAAALVVLGLGFVLWNTFLGGGDAGAETGSPVAQVETPDKPEPKPNVDPAPAATATEAAKTAEEKLAEVLEQADASLAEADYAAAVVFFNEALSLDPGNAEFQKRLESAAENYRIQQAKQERWNQALQDFDHGDYRAAMAYFYRLPEDEHTESVDRYIRNGWYNLGLSALKNRECTEALDHFAEARRLDSADAGVLEATDLAVRCRREGSNVIQASVGSLSYRGLEDAP